MTAQDKQLLKRTSWIRCLMFMGIWFSFLILTHIPVYLIFDELASTSASGFSEISAQPLYRITAQFCSVVSVLAAVFIMRKYIEKESATFPYLNPDFKGFVNGCLVALALIASLSLILLTSGLVAFSFTASLSGLLPYVVLYMLVAIHEEVLCRGYLLDLFNRAHGKFIGIILSSLIFTCLHLLNSHVSWLGLSSIFLSGVLLALFFLRKKNLWAPIGIHFAWNYAQGPLFGFAVSGHQNSGILQAKFLSQNTTLTGGAFGLEGSLITVLVLAIAILLYIGLHLNARRKETSIDQEDLTTTAP